MRWLHRLWQHACALWNVFWLLRAHEDGDVLQIFVEPIPRDETDPRSLCVVSFRMEGVTGAVVGGMLAPGRPENASILRRAVEVARANLPAPVPPLRLKPASGAGRMTIPITSRD